MKTIATLFSGGEGVGVGAKMAGIAHLWGIEYDDQIAGVARMNGFNTITANVLDIDPATMERPDILHASPVCTRASVANANGEESELDLTTAQATARFIDILKPDYFTLENVYPYRNFKSFGIITAALTRNGYWWNYDNLNAADYGVPQTRRRLVLIASRVSLLPTFPPPVKWVGWYEAIEDLIPTLPETTFAPWQLARLPEMATDFLVNGSSTMEVREKYRPVATQVSADRTLHQRAFIVDGKLNDNSTILTSRDGHNRVMTITTSHNNRDIKAFVSNTRELHKTEAGAKYTTATQQTPIYTIVPTSSGARHKAWLSSGRVVKMTPRALARFQSFPDWYILPDKAALATKVIGNAVPPLMYKKVIEALTR